MFIMTLIRVLIIVTLLNINLKIMDPLSTLLNPAGPWIQLLNKCDLMLMKIFSQIHQGYTEIARCWTKSSSFKLLLQYHRIWCLVKSC